MSRLFRSLPFTCLLFATALFVALLPAGDRSVRTNETTPAPCVGNGTDGRRVMLVYARTSADPDEYSTAATAIRQMAATMNAAMRTAADKNVRWHCSSSGTVTVERVIVESHRLSACHTALAEAGHSRTDRLYVCFMRTSDDGFNGQAEIVHEADEKVSPSPHDAGPRYGSIYSISESRAGGLMHEFGHLIGAVQCSAPHSTCPGGERGHHHCFEEQDIMCLMDGGSYFAQGGKIVDRCPEASTLAARWDCGRDDYFNPSPAPGSYLATHWNTYDSLFLHAATVSPEPAPEPTSVSNPTAGPAPAPSPSPTKTPATTKKKIGSNVWTVLRTSRERSAG